VQPAFFSRVTSGWAGIPRKNLWRVAAAGFFRLDALPVGLPKHQSIKGDYN